MDDCNSLWARIPVAVYAASIFGGTLGALIGNALWLSHRILNETVLPEAGVDPKPSGSVSGWVAGSGLSGAIVGFTVSALAVMYWRFAQRSRNDS